MASTRYIQFSITTAAGTSSITVEDRRIVSIPMESAITTTVDYSVVGTPICNGNLYDGRILWTGAQFLITHDDYSTLLGLVRRQESQRRAGNSFAITFKNVLYPFIDPDTTRTRAIASGVATVQSDGTLSYFASHNVAIVAMGVERTGSYYTVNMDWQELDLSA